jgi:hypothetical protein
MPDLESIMLVYASIATSFSAIPDVFGIGAAIENEVVNKNVNNV